MIVRAFAAARGLFSLDGITEGSALIASHSQALCCDLDLADVMLLGEEHQTVEGCARRRAARSTFCTANQRTRRGSKYRLRRNANILA